MRKQLETTPFCNQVRIRDCDCTTSAASWCQIRFETLHRLHGLRPLASPRKQEVQCKNSVCCWELEFIPWSTQPYMANIVRGQLLHHTCGWSQPLDMTLSTAQHALHLLASSTATASQSQPVVPALPCPLTAVTPPPAHTIKTNERLASVAAALRRPVNNTSNV